MNAVLTVLHRRARTSPDDRSTQVRPSHLHRGLSLLALLALFQGTTDAIRAQAVGNRDLLVLLLALYGAMLLLAVLILTVRRQNWLVRVDVVVLVVGALRLAELFAASTGHHFPAYADDEGPLITLAAHSFASGGHAYGVHWPNFAHQFQVSGTPLVNGGIADSFGYPPLSALLVAPLVLWLPSWVPIAGLLCFGALLLTAVLLFRLLPVPLRPAAALLCFGFGWNLFYVRNGYPIFLALPFLVLALYAWTRIGAGGVLGRHGVTSAVCLGIAASAHQLAWFLVPFLLAGVLLSRRAELTWRQALVVTARYASVVLGTFLLINAPFLLRDGRAWLPGVLSVLTQHAEPQGLGAVDISYYLLPGSGALDLYGTAAAALLAATFVALFLFPRRLAPALALLPWPAFYLSVRSPETYFVLLAPLWLLAFATCPRGDFGRLWQWRPRLLADHRVRRAAVPALLVLPALGCLLFAVLSPPPLVLRVGALTSGRTADGTSGVAMFEVNLRNVSGRAITPHFAVSNSAWMDFGWRIRSGPPTLSPRQTGHYVLSRTGPAMALNTRGPTYLRVVSDNPQTLTSTVLVRPADGTKN